MFQRLVLLLPASTPLSFDTRCPHPPPTQAFRTDHGSGNGDGEAKAVAEALLEESLRRGTADNVTVVIMLFAWGSG